MKKITYYMLMVMNPLRHDNGLLLGRRVAAGA